MSSIVKFFVATRVNALAALETGPDTSTRLVTFGNFDAEEALLEWESHLTGRSFSALVDGDIPEVVAEIEDGPVILALSQVLMETLTSAPSHRIDELAQWWINEKAEEGTEIGPPVASGILRDLVELMGQERGPGEHIYCWIG